MRSKKRWDELSTTGRALVIVVACVQLTLAISAWSDLARRPASDVHGPKRLWAGVIAINFVGPILYFWRGRRSATDA